MALETVQVSRLRRALSCLSLRTGSRAIPIPFSRIRPQGQVTQGFESYAQGDDYSRMGGDRSGVVQKKSTVRSGGVSLLRTTSTRPRGRTVRNLGTATRTLIIRSGERGRLSRILQVCDIQCDPLERGRLKLCLASVATEIRPTDNTRMQSRQAALRRALVLTGATMLCSLAGFRPTVIMKRDYTPRDACTPVKAGHRLERWGLPQETRPRDLAVRPGSGQQVSTA